MSIIVSVRLRDEFYNTDDYFPRIMFTKHYENELLAQSCFEYLCSALEGNAGSKYVIDISLTSPSKEEILPAVVYQLFFHRKPELSIDEVLELIKDDANWSIDVLSIEPYKIDSLFDITADVYHFELRADTPRQAIDKAKSMLVKNLKQEKSSQKEAV